MRRIVTLVLMMLIGSYGAAQAQTEEADQTNQTQGQNQNQSQTQTEVATQMEEQTSLNVGIGISFDPSVQVLAKGFEEGAEVPNDVTAVRFKKEGRFGWAFMASFTF